MIYLMKRHVIKYISFYILKKDYRRLHSMEREEDIVNLDVEIGLNEVPDIASTTNHHNYAAYEIQAPITPIGKGKVHTTTPRDNEVQPPANSRFPTPISISRSMTKEEIV
jgi:hypothetical protein